MPRPRPRTSIGDQVRRVLAERLAPRQAAAAVFLGIALGIIPIYGAQSIVALALATLFRLNRPLTLAATFVNNPVLQPFLVFGSLELGHRALHGAWVPVSPSTIMASGWQTHVLPFFLGSVVLAIALALPAAAMAYAAFAWSARRRTGDAGRDRDDVSSRAMTTPTPGEDAAVRSFEAEVLRRFAGARSGDRGFVRWKVRLDRIFRVLLRQDLGSGPVVDLGCGYGLALLVAALQDPGRPLHGCDLDPRRIAAARQALDSFDTRLSVADAARFEMPSAGLIMIIDVLQYFDRVGQTALLSRCCEALQPGGRLIFRVPETRPGITSRLTAWLDLAVFKVGAARTRPVYLSAADYHQLLREAGLTTTELTCRSRLPLSHVLFLAQKPGARVDVDA